MNRNTTKNIKLKDAFELFIVEKETSSVGAKGISNYESTFKKFNRELNLGENILVSDISKQHIMNWISLMKESEIRSASINHYLTEIRVFLYWCMEERYLENFEIKNIKANEEVIKFYNDEEVNKLVKKSDKNCTFAEYRTYVIRGVFRLYELLKKSLAFFHYAFSLLYAYSLINDKVLISLIIFLL